jgi:hypothetical protein
VTRLLFVLLSASLALPALAGEEDEDDFFSLDAVFVSRFGAEPESLAAEAERIRALVAERLAEQHLVVPIEEIPPFEDYSAKVYLDACPKGELLGCAFVLGERAEADWVVTGTVRPGEVAVDLMESAGEGAGSSSDVNIAFVDVAQSQVLLSFDVNVTNENEAKFVQGVGDVLDRILEGAARLEDERGELEDEGAARERFEAEAEIAAQALSELEDELGVMAREDLERIEAPKLKRSDLDEYDDRDDATPWERFDMTQAEFVRFRNSGKTVEDWRTLKKDRAGQLLLRVDASVGSGPFNEVYDGRWALDNQTLQVVETQSYQEVVKGSSLVANLEVGVGILPYLDAGFVIGTRSSNYDYLFYKEVVGQPDDPGEFDSSIVQSLQMGGRATFAPMATYPARPSVSAGVMYWKGVTMDSVIDPTSVPVESLAAPWVLMVQVAPGAEVRMSKAIVLFTRAQVSIPVAGDRVQTAQSGVASLTNRGTPSGATGIGIEGVAGVQVRVNLLGGGKKPKRYRR